MTLHTAHLQVPSSASPPLRILILEGAPDDAERLVRELATAAAVAAHPLHGTETVLVVEDNPTLRHCIRVQLEGGGYTVLAAASPSEAVAFAGGQGQAAPIHLVLTDVVLPEMSGPAVAARLAVLLPEARLLYMSGYSGEVIARRGLVPPGAPLIEKPFTTKNLLRKVRDLLDAGPRGAAR